MPAVILMLKEILSPTSEIDEEFKKGKIKLAIVFPQHFSEDLQHFNKAQVQLIADASDPNTANSLPIMQLLLLMITKIGSPMTESCLTQ